MTDIPYVVFFLFLASLVVGAFVFFGGLSFSFLKLALGLIVVGFFCILTGLFLDNFMI